MGHIFLCIQFVPLGRFQRLKMMAMAPQNFGRTTNFSAHHQGLHSPFSHVVRQDQVTIRENGSEGGFVFEAILQSSTQFGAWQNRLLTTPVKELVHQEPAFMQSLLARQVSPVSSPRQTGGRNRLSPWAPKEVLSVFLGVASKNFRLTGPNNQPAEPCLIDDKHSTCHNVRSPHSPQEPPPQPSHSVVCHDDRG